MPVRQLQDHLTVFDVTRQAGLVEGIESSGVDFGNLGKVYYETIFFVYFGLECRGEVKSRKSNE